LDDPVPTDEERYDELTDRVMALYRAQRYAEAIALVEDHLAALPSWHSDLAHTAACLHARCGDPDAALTVLTKAADAGAWWHPDLLADDDLAPAVELPGFAELVERSRSRHEEAQRAAASLPALVLRPDGPARGVVVVLHGAGQRAARVMPRWRSAAADSLVVVAVESSQLRTPTYRSWPDQGAAARDVAAALETLEPAERALPVVAAGFSAGARAALLWALRGQPRTVAGFVAVAPAVWPDQVADPQHVPPGLVLVGAEDEMVEEVVASVRHLPGVGLDVVPGLGHAYPDDFADRLAAQLRRFVP
jgi:dienelactone hydrolase